MVYLKSTSLTLSESCTYSYVISEGALCIDEVVDAFAVQSADKPRRDSKNRMPQLFEISRYCSSRVVLPKGQPIEE